MILLTLFFLVSAAAATPAVEPTPASAEPDRRITAPVSARVTAAPVIEYDPAEVPTIYTKIRYATAIVFPDAERIVEVVCGDKDWWQVAGPDRIVYIKPSKAGITTNLTVIGTSGNIYQFFLQEISRDPATDLPIDQSAPKELTRRPYVRVSMVLPPQQVQQLVASGPKYIPRAEFESTVQDYQQQLQAAQAEIRDTKTNAKQVIEQELSRIRTNYPAALQFNYQIALGVKPFFVTAMFADDRFTYLKLESDEAPAIYEVKDGKPNLVNFDFVNGVFVIRKVVDQGYLAIGKTKLEFSRKTK